MKRVYNRRYIVVSSIRCAFAILLALKLDGTEDSPWALVFLPIWMYFVYQFFWAAQVTGLFLSFLFSLLFSFSFFLLVSFLFIIANDSFAQISTMGAVIMNKIDADGQRPEVSALHTNDKFPQTHSERTIFFIKNVELYFYFIYFCNSINFHSKPQDMDPVKLAEAQRGLSLLAMGQSELCALWGPASLSILIVCYLEIGNLPSRSP